MMMTISLRRIGTAAAASGTLALPRPGRTHRGPFRMK
jgi:hypothetical protein